MPSALIIVDVQNDFCDADVPAGVAAGDGTAPAGGSLAVAGGTQVARAIAAMLSGRSGASGSNDTSDASGHGYDHVVATRDLHVDPGTHFSETPDFVDSWPAHCVAGTPGAQLHAALDQSLIDAVFDKGAHAAAYSGFEGTSAGRSLEAWLTERDVDRVDVVGIATDHCVRATALDAARLGLRTTVLLDLTAGVAAGTVQRALEQLRAAGVSLRGTPTVRA